MEGLAVAIQKQEIGFPDGVIANELESFEYEYTEPVFAMLVRLECTTTRFALWR